MSQGIFLLTMMTAFHFWRFWKTDWKGLSSEANPLYHHIEGGYGVKINALIHPYIVRLRSRRSPHLENEGKKSLKGYIIPMDIIIAFSISFIFLLLTLPEKGPLTSKDLSMVVTCSHLAIEAFDKPPSPS